MYQFNSDVFKGKSEVIGKFNTFSDYNLAIGARVVCPKAAAQPSTVYG